MKLFFPHTFFNGKKNFLKCCFCPIFSSSFNKQQKHISVFLFCCKTLISKSNNGCKDNVDSRFSKSINKTILFTKIIVNIITSRQF